ncbi:unnamed protein product, partial [marine sediment metagenome]
MDMLGRTVMGTTIESNRHYKISNTPSIFERAWALREFNHWLDTMITIEPILDFDLE